MDNRYESVVYSTDNKIILDTTLLTSEEKKLISSLRFELKDKKYSSIIEDFYKFHKNNYTTSDLAKMFSVSTRQIQIIFKDLGINRDRFSAQISSCL